MFSFVHLFCPFSSDNDVIDARYMSYGLGWLSRLQPFRGIPRRVKQIPVSAACRNILDLRSREYSQAAQASTHLPYYRTCVFWE